MGAVHGVYLKYVAASLLSYGGYISLQNADAQPLVRLSSQTLIEWDDSLSIPLWKILLSGALAYSACVNGMIAALFKLRKGMGLLGKDPKTGHVPMWSHILYFPFHICNYAYTAVHYAMDKRKTGKKAIPAASEVQKGWYVGGRYSNELDMKNWGGVIDLTSEFPESCINDTQAYLLIPLWDGVPPTPAQLEEAANFAVEAHKKGPVLIHCAHGRGRSTTTMCAALVKAGLFENWKDAFEKGIKPQRSCCKLNSAMRKSLTQWQEQYVDCKKSS